MRPVIELRAVLVCLVSLLLAACGSGGGNGTAPVLTGAIGGIPESEGHWLWGDDNQQLCQQWSLENTRSGFFYGSDHEESSNVDVYVAVGMTKPLRVRDATQFSYSSEPQIAAEGDTVFFRNANGFYGAWTIEAIDAQAQLYGRWYFQADGSGDFTTGTIDTEIPLRDIGGQQSCSSVD